MDVAPYKPTKEGADVLLCVSTFDHKRVPMYAYSGSLPSNFAEVLDKQ